MSEQVYQSEVSPFFVAKAIKKLSLKGSSTRACRVSGHRASCQHQAENLVSSMGFETFFEKVMQLNHALKLANARFTDDSATLIPSFVDISQTLIT